MGDMEEELTARFTAQRGGVVLPTMLVTLLVDYLVDHEMAQD